MTFFFVLFLIASVFTFFGSVSTMDLRLFFFGFMPSFMVTLILGIVVATS